MRNIYNLIHSFPNASSYRAASDPCLLTVIESLEVTIAQRTTKYDNLADVSNEDGAPPAEPSNIDDITILEADRSFVCGVALRDERAILVSSLAIGGAPNPASTSMARGAWTPSRRLMGTSARLF